MFHLTENNPTSSVEFIQLNVIFDFEAYPDDQTQFLTLNTLGIYCF